MTFTALVEITFVEAIKGTRANVATLNGTVALTIPAGTQPGARLRLKGQGLQVNGDELATIMSR